MNLRLEMTFGLKNKFGAEKEVRDRKEVCILIEIRDRKEIIVRKRNKIILLSLSLFPSLSRTLFLSPSLSLLTQLIQWETAKVVGWWPPLSLSSDPADPMRDGEGGPLFSLPISLYLFLSPSKPAGHNDRDGEGGSLLSLSLSLSQSLL